MDSPSALTPRISSASSVQDPDSDHHDEVEVDRISRSSDSPASNAQTPRSDVFDRSDREESPHLSVVSDHDHSDSLANSGVSASEVEVSDLSDQDSDAGGNPGSASDGCSYSPPHRKPRASRTMVEDALESARQNPALYGLRRSTRRTRNQTQIIESESESDPGPQAKRRRTAVRTSRVPSRHPSQSSSNEGGNSDSSGYGAPRPRRVQKKKQADDDYLRASRGSRRAAAQNVNYFEQEEDDDDDREYYYVDTNDNSPSIDLVLHHRCKTGVSLDGDDDLCKSDFEYLIKWQGQARYHATWVSYDSVVPQKARKIDNYFNKLISVEIDMARNPEAHAEDKEQWSLDLEQRLDSLEENKQIDRVIAKRRNDSDEIEYLVKWKGLPYEAATWEEDYLTQQLSEDQIAKFERRTLELPTSDRLESIPATRSKFLNWSQLAKGTDYQPSYIRGTLRGFQKFGVMWLGYNWTIDTNSILADEMGLGKTVQTVAFLSWLRHERMQDGPFLVVVPLSTISAWAETFNAWDPELNYVVYQGNDSSRQIIREHELLEDNQPSRVRFNALLTSYEYINRDTDYLSRIKWQVLVVDEAHRLKNSESDLYRNLSRYQLGYRLLLTGTPLQNNILELSSLLHFIDPAKFSKDNDFDVLGDDHEFIAGKIRELGNAIKPHILRRVKTDVERDLPRKTEFILRVPLANAQRELYTNIHERNYAALMAQVGSGHSMSLINVMMESRKAANHPFLFPSMQDELTRAIETRADYLRVLITSSGKMVLLDKLLDRLKKEGHRVLIFSQMVKMIDIMNEYLRLRRYQYQRLDGNVPSDQRRKAMDHFNAPESEDFVFLLSTRAGGLGINLVTADTVILFDSDWNPQADIQAMCRAHRIGQRNPVTVYRFVSEATVEEDILAAGVNKLFIEHLTIQMGVTDKEGLANITDKFKKAGALSEAPTSSDQINNLLKKRAQRMFENPDQQDQLEALDIDSFLEQAEEAQTVQSASLATDAAEEFLRSFDQNAVNINVDWDQIVPQDRLEKFREETEKQREEDEMRQLMMEGQPRQRKPVVRDDGYDDLTTKATKRRLKQRKATSSAGSDDEEGSAGALSEADLRRLIHGFEKFGAWEDMSTEIVKYAGLGKRDPALLKGALTDLIDHCQALVDKKKAEWSRAGLTAKKDRQAILFTFRGVTRLNAETLLSRPWQLRVIRKAVKENRNWQSFRISEVDKFPHYTCEWGPREDGMLLIGITRHGFGNWSAIANDAELDMKDRMFLEEHREKSKKDRANGVATTKSPGPLHLIRRVQHLANVLAARRSDTRVSSLAKRESRSSRHSTGGAKSRQDREPAERDHGSSKGSGRDRARADVGESNGSARASRSKGTGELSASTKDRTSGRGDHRSVDRDSRPAGSSWEQKAGVTKLHNALMSLPSFKKRKSEFSSIGAAPDTLPPRPVDRNPPDRTRVRTSGPYSAYRDERRGRDSRDGRDVHGPGHDRRRRSRSRTPPRDERYNRARKESPRDGARKESPRDKVRADWHFRPDGERDRDRDRDRDRGRERDRERDRDRDRTGHGAGRDREGGSTGGPAGLIRRLPDPQAFTRSANGLPRPPVASIPRPWAR